ncbi:hypothetical protein ElyMa_002319400 [Elysia marginata]|uniref:Uncharacterized protein n=1 Tax=Elysia marginata TaxID=1093978 RepID=A0AAV4G6K2_9GAST|nr:hypothetical protein ElyMa_002319400 [Elysia marginata]
MGVCSKISADILKSCDNPSVQGMKQRIVLINTEDLPATGITFDSTNPATLITKIQLEKDKTGYEVEGINQIMSFNNTMEVSEDSFNGVKHTLTGIQITDPSETARNEINKFIKGANVYAVLERNWKGINNEHAFLFFGLKFGLEVSELTESAKENGGAIVLSLSTPSGFKEPYLPHIYRDTDYATSLTTFNNKFVS